MNSDSQILRQDFKSTWMLRPVIDFFKYMLVIGVIAWLMVNGTERLGYNWQWYRVPQYIVTMVGNQPTPGPLILGLLITIRITVISLVQFNNLGINALV